jgi:molybdopterin synthase sulfur carrier subunit
VTVVRYFAAAKAAAGVAEDPVEAGTLADVLSSVRARHDERFSAVLSVCSFLVDGAPVGTRPPERVVVGVDALVDCLPPFAGG